MATVAPLKIDSGLSAADRAAVAKAYIGGGGNSGSISYGPITPQSLQPQSVPAIPYGPGNPYSGAVAGGSAMLAGNIPTLTQAQLDAQNAALGRTQFNTGTEGTSAMPDLFQQYLASLPKPPSLTDTYKADYASSGIDQKTNEYNLAKQQFDALNAQMQGITAEGNAAKLAQENTFGTTGNTIGQQAHIDRQTAIKQLGLQGQALVAQANLTNSQAILNQAQQHFDAMFQIHAADAKAQYDYQTNLVKAVYDYADKQQQAALDALKLKSQQTFASQQNNLNYAQSLATTAITNGQPQIAAKISALDPMSATYRADVAKLAGQIVKPATSSDSLLSVSEAQSLGVPYGTTKSQAMGVTPQKPATAAQETTALYANRIEQSNAILTGMDSKIAGMNPLVYGGASKLPSWLQSGDIQSVQQAQRNFVNAVLRRESGASISPSEFDSATKQYFATAGDTAATIAQKQANRDLVMRGFVSGAGSAYTPLANSSQTVTSNGKTYNVGQVYEDASKTRWTIDASGKWSKQ